MAKIKIDGDEKDKMKNQKKDNVSDEEITVNEEDSLKDETKAPEAGSEKEISESKEQVTEEEQDPEEGKKSQSFFSKKKQKDSSKHEKELENEVTELKKALTDQKASYVRLLADFDNYKKRTARETETRYLDSKADTLKKFLQVIDAYERALKTEVPEESKQYTSGYEMIYEIFTKILKENGVEEIEALGKEFNPGLHNAVMHVEDDSVGPNTIVEVFEKGYRMGDRILRYSIVKVAN